MMVIIMATGEMDWVKYMMIYNVHSIGISGSFIMVMLDNDDTPKTGNVIYVDPTIHTINVINDTTIELEHK